MCLACVCVSALSYLFSLHLREIPPRMIALVHERQGILVHVYVKEETQSGQFREFSISAIRYLTLGLLFSLHRVFGVVAVISVRRVRRHVVRI